MAVFRVIKDKENPYVMLNKYSLYDKNLSYKAKGILSYCLSRPDNWEFYEEEISSHSTDGLASIKTGLKELMNKGYIVRKRKRDVLGKFKGYEYLVYEVPQTIKEDSLSATISPKCDFPTTDNPLTENPTLEKPSTENRMLLNNDNTNYRNKLNNELSNSSNSSKGNMEVFKHFEKCNFGLLSPMLIEKIAADIEIYSREWVIKAAEISDEAGVHRYDYVKSILENWKANGGIKEKKEVKSNGTGNSFKKNTGESKGKWEGYRPAAPKVTGEADTTGLI